MLPFFLEILPIAQLIPVEQPALARVECIKRELLRSGHLANPLLVLEEKEGGYLLLHGINHFEVFKNLEIRDVVVQVIGANSTGVEFLSWYHLARHCRPEHLIQIAESHSLRHEFVKKVEKMESHNAAKELLCVFLEGDILRIFPDNPDLLIQAKALNCFIESYQAFSSYLKLYPDSLFLESTELSELGELLIVPPLYSQAEILSLAQAGILFPPDCLSVTFENRIVGLDFPLEVLSSAAAIEEKRLFLKELIRLRMQSERSTMLSGKILFMGNNPQ